MILGGDEHPPMGPSLPRRKFPTLPNPAEDSIYLFMEQTEGEVSYE